MLVYGCITVRKARYLDPAALHIVKGPQFVYIPQVTVQQNYPSTQPLLEIAFMPPPAAGLPNTQTALNEKDVVDEDEADEDEKPTAPAVKVEEDDEHVRDSQQEDDVPVDKLYLSDDDIGEF